MRDSFFSNLITGIKYNNGNKKINSIKAINSDSALIYNVNKFLNDLEEDLDFKKYANKNELNLS